VLELLHAMGYGTSRSDLQRVGGSGDGDQLSALMMDHGVGVSHKALQVPKADSDYFEDD